MDFITFAAAKKYAKDISLGEEKSSGKKFFWNGDTTGLAFVEYELDEHTKFGWYKISDEILTEEEVRKGEFIVFISGSDNLTYSIPIDAIKSKTEKGSFYATNTNWGIPAVIVCGSNGDKIFGEGIASEVSVTLPETGLWIFSGIPDYYVMGLNIKPDITTIDSKFLPERCAGREFGTRVYWDFAPTDTFVQFGWCVDLENVKIETQVEVFSNDESKEVPEGTAFYKVSEKINSLNELTFDMEFYNYGIFYGELNSDTIVSLFDADSGDKLGEGGKLITEDFSMRVPAIINLQSAGKIIYEDVEAIFPESGLYFLYVPKTYNVARIYDNVYNNFGGIGAYRVAETIDDLLFCKVNFATSGEGNQEIIIRDSEDYEEGLYGKTETGSSYCFPYILNIKSDNEIIDFSKLAEDDSYKFYFEKSGLYIANIAEYNPVEDEKNSILIKGRDYQMQKIDKRFLPFDIGEYYTKGQVNSQYNSFQNQIRQLEERIYRLEHNS